MSEITGTAPEYAEQQRQLLGELLAGPLGDELAEAVAVDGDMSRAVARRAVRATLQALAGRGTLSTQTGLPMSVGVGPELCATPTPFAESYVADEIRRRVTLHIFGPWGPPRPV